MSRFWGASESEESTTSDESISSDDAFVPAGRIRHFSSDEEDDVKRVVLSHKEKELIATNEAAKKLRVALRKKNNWIEAQQCYTELNKQLQKYSKKAKKEPTPPSYFKALCALLDSVNSMNLKSAKRELLGKQFKALNGMHLQLRKESKRLSKEIAAYRKDPLPESEEEAEVEDEQDTPADGSVPASSAADAVGSDASGDDDSDSNSDAAEPEEQPARQRRGLSYWLKKGGASSSSDSSSSSSSDDGGLSSDGESGDTDLEDPEYYVTETQHGTEAVEESTPKDDGDEKDANLPPPKKVWTVEKVDEALEFLFAPRSGRRKLSYNVLVKELTSLLEHAKNDAQRIVMHLELVKATNDEYTKLNVPLKRSVWLHSFVHLSAVVDLITADSSLDLNPPAILRKFIQFGEDIDHAKKLVVYGTRLHKELLKKFRATEPHSPAYLRLMRDEEDLLMLLKRVQSFYRRIRDTEGESHICLLRLLMLYYRPPTDEAFDDYRYERAQNEAAERAEALAVQRAQKAKAEQESKEGQAEESKDTDKENQESADTDDDTASQTNNTVSTGTVVTLQSGVSTSSRRGSSRRPQSRQKLILKLCNIIFSRGDQRQCATALLCQVYHLAVYDHFYKARDLLLMSRIQENVSHMDVRTQVLFNRAMVQLGLCAFRAGLVSESHDCLAELYSGGRVKELLAQGLSSVRPQDRTKAQEDNRKKEKSRQIPYHMQVNLELLECVHLICAGLLEVPVLAASAFNVKVRYGGTRTKEISRWFRRLTDLSARQVFPGPPETPRDHVVAGCKRISTGDWRGACDILLNLNCWKVVGDRWPQVRDRLRELIKEVALRTYLITYAHVYTSFSLEQLAELFDLKSERVHCIVSKMIVDDELSASWHQPTSTVRLHRTEHTRSQALALQVIDKVSTFVDYNERVFDQVTGSNVYRGDRGGDRNNDRDNTNKKNQYQDRQQSGGQRSGWQGKQSGYQGNNNRSGGYRNRRGGQSGNRGGMRHSGGNRSGGYRNRRGGGSHSGGRRGNYRGRGGGRRY